MQRCHVVCEHHTCMLLLEDSVCQYVKTVYAVSESQTHNWHLKLQGDYRVRNARYSVPSCAVCIVCEAASCCQPSHQHE